MDLFECQLHSFIIKIWVEEASEEPYRAGWRGQIKHVPSGAHRHIKSFGEIADFMNLYLQSNSPKPIKPRRRWIDRLRLRK